LCRSCMQSTTTRRRCKTACALRSGSEGHTTCRAIQ
jgi:hypothetical protein